LACPRSEPIAFDPKTLKSWLDADKNAKKEKKDKRAKKSADGGNASPDTSGEAESKAEGSAA